MSAQDDFQFIKANIGRHKQFALGTVGVDGKPWNVCLSLTYDDQFNIIWQSRYDTEHSKHVRANSDVAICIFSKDESVGDFGLYIKARAREIVDPEELERLIVVRSTQTQKNQLPINKLSGKSPLRLYYAEVTEAWFNDDSHIKKPIDLELLRGMK